LVSFRIDLITLEIFEYAIEEGYASKDENNSSLSSDSLNLKIFFSSEQAIILFSDVQVKDGRAASGPPM
jgi:hypothetical protein